jgi:hypothetical protein
MEAVLIDQMKADQIDLLLEKRLNPSNATDIDFWVRTLLEVKTPVARNRLALKLSDVSDSKELFSALTQLLQDTKTIGARGTLLYALRKFDCANIFPLLIDFVIAGGWEVAHEAHARICAIDSIDNTEIEYKKIRDVLAVNECLEWRRELLEDLKKLFIDPLNYEEMSDFWRWFKFNERALFDARGDFCNLYNELDEMFNSFTTCLGWEIGPQENDRMCFVASPNMRRNLIAQAREVISHHPNLDETRWCFQVGRQRRPWSDIIKIAQNEKSSLSEIDLSQWKHLVFRVPDSELFDIVFSCGENCRFSDDDLAEVATLVAVGLLGEMVVLERVDQIEVVKAFDGEKAKRAKPAEWLPYAFGMKSL